MLGSLIGGALGLVGGLFQNSAQQASADKQMKFQKEMDNTKYQRTMTDMKAAGLNPMLAYSQGGGSAPSGAQAAVTNVGDAAARGMQAGASSAASSALLKHQIANVDADTAAKIASASAATEQAKLNAANSAMTLGTLQPRIQQAIAEATSAELMTDVSGAKSDRALAERKYLNTLVGQILATAALGGRDANEASSAVKNFGSLVNDTFKTLGFGSGYHPRGR